MEAGAECLLSRNLSVMKPSKLETASWLPFTLENMFINSEMNHCCIYAKSAIQGYIVIFHSHSRLSLLFHVNPSPLLLNLRPGLLPDFPSLIMESSEDRSGLCYLEGQLQLRESPAALFWLVCYGDVSHPESSADMSWRTKCPEMMPGKTESV